MSSAINFLGFLVFVLLGLFFSAQNQALKEALKSIAFVDVFTALLNAVFICFFAYKKVETLNSIIGKNGKIKVVVLSALMWLAWEFVLPLNLGSIVFFLILLLRLKYNWTDLAKAGLVLLAILPVIELLVKLVMLLIFVGPEVLLDDAVRSDHSVPDQGKKWMMVGFFVSLYLLPYRLTWPILYGLICCMLIFFTDRFSFAKLWLELKDLLRKWRLILLLMLLSLCQNFFIFGFTQKASYFAIREFNTLRPGDFEILKFSFFTTRSSDPFKLLRHAALEALSLRWDSLNEIIRNRDFAGLTDKNYHMSLTGLPKDFLTSSGSGLSGLNRAIAVGSFSLLSIVFYGCFFIFRNSQIVLKEINFYKLLLFCSIILMWSELEFFMSSDKKQKNLPVFNLTFDERFGKNVVAVAELAKGDFSSIIFLSTSGSSKELIPVSSATCSMLDHTGDVYVTVNFSSREYLDGDLHVQNLQRLWAKKPWLKGRCFWKSQGYIYFERGGKIFRYSENLGEQMIFEEKDGFAFMPSVSGDGRFLIFNLQRKGQHEVVVFDLQRNSKQKRFRGLHGSISSEGILVYLEPIENEIGKKTIKIVNLINDEAKTEVFSNRADDYHYPFIFKNHLFVTTNTSSYSYVYAKNLQTGEECSLGHSSSFIRYFRVFQMP